MSQISIEKVKLIKSEKLEVNYRVTLDDKTHVSRSEERDTKPHPDLSNAFSKLAMHFALLCDYLTVKTCKTPGALDTFVITGYSIGGKEDEEGVVITGYKLTKSGQALTLNSPFTRFDQEDATGYFFRKQLFEDIQACDIEVLAYLDGSKKAPDPQMSMFDEQGKPKGEGEDDSEETDQADEEVKAPPKQRGRRKKI